MNLVKDYFSFERLFILTLILISVIVVIIIILIIESSA